MQQLEHSDPHISCGLFHFEIDLLIEVISRKFAKKSVVMNIYLQFGMAIISYMSTFIQYDLVVSSIEKSSLSEDKLLSNFASLK